MRALDLIARRYGTRPSVIVGEHDPWTAFCIDFWCCNWGHQMNDPKPRR